MTSHTVRSSLRLLVTAAGLALLASSGPARADIISIGDSELPGRFTGSVEVKNQTTTTAVIQIILKNTSPAANGGYLTGFAFNDPGIASKGDINGVSSFGTSYSPATGQSFPLIGGPGYTNGIPGSPYGSYDIGAAVGGSLLGGGNPSAGLAVGETGTFTFAVTGTGLNNLTAANLLAATSTNGTAGMFVRFRGFCDDSSDKDVVTAPPTPSAVPAPPGALLAGVGVGCLLLGRLRRRTAPI